MSTWRPNSWEQCMMGYRHWVRLLHLTCPPNAICPLILSFWVLATRAGHSDHWHQEWKGWQSVTDQWQKANRQATVASDHLPPFHPLTPLIDRPPSGSPGLLCLLHLLHLFSNIITVSSAHVTSVSPHSWVLIFNVRFLSLTAKSMWTDNYRTYFSIFLPLQIIVWLILEKQGLDAFGK